MGSSQVEDGDGEPDWEAIAAQMEPFELENPEEVAALAAEPEQQHTDSAGSSQFPAIFPCFIVSYCNRPIASVSILVSYFPVNPRHPVPH